MDVEKLEAYHKVRKSGEFPSPTTVGGFFLGASAFGITTEAAFHNLPSDLLSTLAGAIAGATLGFVLDRRASRASTEKFLNEFLEDDPART